MRSHIKTQKGFTMVELMVYLGLVTMVIVVLTSFFVDVSRNAAQAKIDNEVQQNARLVFSRLTQELRSANTIDTNASIFGNPVGKITFEKDHTTISIFRDSLTDSVVYEIPGIGANLTNSHVCVTKLEFTYTAPMVGIAMIVAPSNDCATTTDSISLHTSVVLRRLLY